MRARKFLSSIAATATVLFVGGTAFALTKDCRPGIGCWGTQSNDRLNGTKSPDAMYGRGGYDELYGGPGSDRLDGGKQGDELYGGAGDDSLIGGPRTELDRQDFLFGNRGDDRLLGRGQSDSLDGGPGDDLLKGGSAVDSYSFAPEWGRDTIADAANTRNTALFRYLVADLVINLTSSPNRPEAKVDGGTSRVNWAANVITSVYGGHGDDKIWGNDDGNSIVLIDGGSDEVYAGAGDDVIYANDLYGEGADTVDCGEGEDVVLNHDNDDVLAENCEVTND